MNYLKREDFFEILVKSEFSATAVFESKSKEIAVYTFGKYPTDPGLCYTPEALEEYMTSKYGVKFIFAGFTSASKALYEFIKSISHTSPKLVRRFCIDDYGILTYYDLEMKLVGDNIILLVKRLESPDDTINLMFNKRALTVKVWDIRYVDYGNHSVELYTVDGKRSFFSVSFGEIARVLLEHGNFVRTYKNCLVNMDRIARMENDTFVLDNGETVLMPKRKIREIKHTYEAYYADKAYKKYS